ncbi:MAG TPA: amidase [Aliidongia sp.]|uniref:amidase n=1 Tax=Aliidongia sp. TaxID=1914230 RepID=UPI002DDCEBE0|nr:amidase [Aliidongia sp.]HEV2676984.1 amidase [Aliidongia sp.]
MSEEIALMSAIDLVQAYRARRLSPVEATQAAFDRIRTLDGKVNAFCFLDEEGALAAARASEARWQAGRPQGLVDGVPTSIKDLILVRGWPTLRGSKLVACDQDWSEDAPSVARLKEHGAILLGKTTTPEFGWKGVTDSGLTGITRNPWDLERTPGGSSGGAAVAAALGMGALHIGTDGGGSIRIPAGFTGVYGLKASYGRVPAYPASPFNSVAHVGPMTRTVADTALMLTVLAEPDARDANGLPPAGRDWRVGLDGGVARWRIAYAETINGEPIDPEVAARVAEAVQRLAALGATIEPITLAMPGVGEAFAKHWLSGAAALLAQFTPEQRSQIDPGLQKYAEIGSRYSAIDFLAGSKAREGYTVQVNQLFEQYDLLVTPTLPITAFAAGMNAPDSGPYAGWTGWTPFSYPFNLTRHPAASLPVGFARGMPVGLQLVGPAYREDKVLQASRALEAVLPIALPRLR